MAKARAHVRNISASLAYALVLAACGVNRVGIQEEIARTWTHGWIVVGNELTGRQYGISGEINDKLPEVRQALAGKGRYPVVVYLHGCKGINWETNSVSDHLTDWTRAERYALVMADSFKRSDRAERCLRLRNMELRIEEARYAYRQLAQEPWVDPSAVVLIGQSEGGAAASRYSGDEFAAVVVLGYDCYGRAVEVPKNRPLLTMIGEFDPWRQTGARCSVYGHPPPSQAVVVPGGVHNLGPFPGVAETVRGFLRDVRRNSSVSDAR